MNSTLDDRIGCYCCCFVVFAVVIVFFPFLSPCWFLSVICLILVNVYMERMGVSYHRTHNRHQPSAMQCCQEKEAGFRSDSVATAYMSIICDCVCGRELRVGWRPRNKYKVRFFFVPILLFVRFVCEIEGSWSSMCRWLLLLLQTVTSSVYTCVSVCLSCTESTSRFYWLKAKWKFCDEFRILKCRPA